MISVRSGRIYIINLYYTIRLRAHKVIQKQNVLCLHLTGLIVLSLYQTAKDTQKPYYVIKMMQEGKYLSWHLSISSTMKWKYCVCLFPGKGAKCNKFKWTISGMHQRRNIRISLQYCKVLILVANIHTYPYDQACLSRFFLFSFSEFIWSWLAGNMYKTCTFVGNYMAQ